MNLNFFSKEQNQERGVEVEGAGGAAAAAVPDPAAGNNMANMVGRLREFLTQIEQNFPAVPPAANAENNEDNIDDNLDEFD